MKLLVASGAWLVGVATAILWDVPANAAVSFLVAFVCLVILSRRNGWSLLAPVAVALALLGVLRVELAAPPSEGLRAWIGVRDLKVEGVVVEPPEARGAGLRFRF